MLVKIVSFWWPHVHGVFSPSIEIAFVRLLFICPNSKTNVVNVFVCLQDILSSIDPLLPAALVKCLYLLVCLPAKADNVETEQTFQEPLTKVNSPNWTIFFPSLSLHRMFFLPHFAISCCRSSSLCLFHSMFFFSRSCSSSADSRSMWSGWWKLRRCSVLSSASRRCGTRQAPHGGARPPVSSRRSLLRQPATPSHAC